ncbi:hypothetical protein OIE66_32070 [Nonomuraea sp. NBC_01738]|uniref:hypothetical protein n=1 Tax=Nonomuraea sp. NBC_01738 TaxID=2976003 RepID=UPI002E1219CC|nr:hypothetical protein OIE66_32070 [Nonomuraea sp. NBC_01738]
MTILDLAHKVDARCRLDGEFVRKTAKPYGTRRLAEGAEVKDRQVLIIEDVVTSGGQESNGCRACCD